MSLRELVWMAEGRQKEAWNHTSWLLAMQYNTAFGKKRKAKKPLDFHPFKADAPKRKLTKEEAYARLHAAFGTKDASTRRTKSGRSNHPA